ncbi:beta-galactosidase trimerization domain-containing protein [Paenibacillus arenilitoris]
MEVPGPLAECAGVVVEEWDALSSDAVAVQMNNGNTYQATQWADILEPRGAEPIGWYRSEYYAGKAAITVNKLGSGNAYYIGANFGPDFLSDLFGGLLRTLDIPHIPGLPEGVQASVRRGGEGAYLFLTNFTTSAQTVVLDRARESVLYGGNAGERIRLQPFGVEILLYE